MGWGGCQVSGVGERSIFSKYYILSSTPYLTVVKFSPTRYSDLLLHRQTESTGRKFFNLLAPLYKHPPSAFCLS
jgi:hypothetical protein